METDDRQLLREFAERHSETAFRTLVERHLGLVHAAARRQVGDADLADDVSQAVFLLLARKARDLAPAASLAGWLYRTTSFVARRALRSEMRRQRREREACAMNDSTPNPTPEETWQRIVPRLDDAMNRLGDADRQALLLRYFQDRPHREVAVALGVGEEAAKKRVLRALERLRGFLAGSGVVVTATTLGALLFQHGAEAAPAGLAATLAATAAASGNGTLAGAALSETASTLVRDTLDAWRWLRIARLGGIAAASVAALLVLTAVIPSLRQAATPSTAGNRPATPGPSLDAGNRLAPAAAVPPAPPGPSLLFRVIDARNGQGVPHARLAIQTVVGTDWRWAVDQFTDVTGFVDFPLPPNLQRLDIGVLTNGWVARYATFLPHLGEAIPAEYTLRVPPATAALGGIVTDETGRPVADAEVRIDFANTGDTAHLETPREREGSPVPKAPIARTDRDGRWSASVVARGGPGFSVSVTHPDFAETTAGRRAPTSAGTKPVQDDLWSGDLSTALQRGVAVTGRVLDFAGRPVAGAELLHHPYSFDRMVRHTDADGRFAFPRQPADDFEFAVSAPRLAPEYRKVALDGGLAPLEFRLQPAAVLRFRAVDERGDPAADVEVLLERWNGVISPLPWNARTGPDGRCVWNSAPVEGRLEFCARGNGWCYTRGITCEPGAAPEEVSIVVRRARRLVGRVTDATSGRPLAEFKAFPGYGEGEYPWERLATRRGTEGSYLVVFEEKKDPWRLRIEAEGYAPFISEPLDPDATEPLDVALRPLDPGAGVRGTVLGPDDRPIAGAQVALLTLEHDVRLAGRGLARAGDDPWIVVTDATGGFRFPETPLAHSVVAVHQDGFAHAGHLQPGASVMLRLAPWGRLEGVILASERRRPIVDVWMEPLADRNYRGTVRFDRDRSRSSIDAEGRFAFADVPPLEVKLSLNSGAGTQFHHPTVVQVAPGTTTAVTIGPVGPTVRGRLVLAGVAADPDSGTAKDTGTVPSAERRFQFAYLLSLDPTPPPGRPTDFESTMAAVDYWTSPAGLEWARRGVNRSIQVRDSDGVFVTEDSFPPGDYLLRVGTPRGLRERRVTIPSPGPDTTEVDLGELVIE